MTLIGRISAIITSIAADIKSLYGRVLPIGGTTGQVLGKTSSTDYAVGWFTPSGVGTGNTNTWEKLTLNWSIEPTEIATIANGIVYSYTLLGITRYRLVPTIYNPTQDAFYANFDGVTLTNLIVARG